MGEQKGSFMKQEMPEAQSSAEFLGFVSANFDSKDTSDVELVIQDSASKEQHAVYYLHRLVLLQSDFFGELFYSKRWVTGKSLRVPVGMYENGTVSDEDITTFLKMFYEGDLNQLREEILVRCLQIHHLCRKYEFKRGFAYCENLVSELINEHTIASALSYCLKMDDYASLAFTTCLQWFKVFFFVCQGLIGLECIKCFDHDFLRILASAPDFLTCPNGIPLLVQYYETCHDDGGEAFLLLKASLLSLAKAKDDLEIRASSDTRKITNLISTQLEAPNCKTQCSSQVLDTFQMYGFRWSLICIVDFSAKRHWLSLNARSHDSDGFSSSDAPIESFHVKVKVQIIHRRKTCLTRHKGTIKTNYVRFDIPQSISSECVQNAFKDGILGLIAEVTITRLESRQRGNTW